MNSLNRLAAFLIGVSEDRKRIEAEQEKAALRFFSIAMAAIFGIPLLMAAVGAILYFRYGGTAARVSVVAAVLFLFGWIALLLRLGSPRAPENAASPRPPRQTKFLLTPERHREKAALIRAHGHPEGEALAKASEAMADYMEKGQKKDL